MSHRIQSFTAADDQGIADRSIATVQGSIQQVVRRVEVGVQHEPSAAKLGVAQDAHEDVESVVGRFVRLPRTLNWQRYRELAESLASRHRLFHDTCNVHPCEGAVLPPVQVQ